MIVELKNPEFIPVIELSPFDFKKKRWKEPSDRFQEEQWLKFILKCFADSGINNLIPLKEDNSFFKLKNISNDNLKIILKNHFKRHNMITSIRYWKDRLGFFDGGLIIKEKDQILISPGCCCGLADVKDWSLLINNGNENWQYICIGHPEDFIKYKLVDNKVIFSLYQKMFSIEIDKYNELINKVLKQLNTFENRLNKVIKQMTNRNDYKQISYRLIKGFSIW